MTSQPPLLTGPKNLRVATLLNVMLPGAGLFYLGKRMVGGILAGAFLATFLSVLTIFLVGYARYLSIALGENLLEGTKLEEAGAAFHQHWLLALAGIGVAIYVISSVLFHLAKQRHP